MLMFLKHASDFSRRAFTIFDRRKMKMNKMELVAAAAEKAGMTKKDTEAVIKTAIEMIEAALVGGEKVQLIGFGTFEIRERPARQGKNPRTGETVTIPAARVPVFKAGKALRDAVR